MTPPPRRMPDLRLQVPTREPDDAFLARLTSLARASGEAAALPDTGPTRWKVALVAASVAAIASGGAALADALNGGDRPSPLGPPSQLPAEDRDRQQDPRPERSEPEREPPRSEPDVGSGAPADPPEQRPPGMPESVASQEEDPDDLDGSGDDGDDDTGDEPDDETAATRDEDGVREDEWDDRDDPDTTPEPDDTGNDESDDPGGSRDG